MEKMPYQPELDTTVRLDGGIAPCGGRRRDWRAGCRCSAERW